jgi:hypothetical protein
MSQTESDAESVRTESSTEDVPVIQQIFDSIWLLAGVAIVFFVLSYLVWGMVDLITIPMGGT